MRRFNDHLRQRFAKLFRIIGVTKVDAKVGEEVDAKTNPESDCCTCRQSPKAALKHKSTVAAKKGWKYRQNTEFPWRLEQVVEEEENWRGTWVLEVKDLQAMEWVTNRVPKADS
ncbi:hypothetical protein LX36DRAFT_546925, partial [Colletotrichum falcatum]